MGIPLSSEMREDSGLLSSFKVASAGALKEGHSDLPPAARLNEDLMRQIGKSSSFF
jgi:hypothetical protein